MKRYMYRAQCREGWKPEACLEAMKRSAGGWPDRLPAENVSVFAHGDEWFLYYECGGEAFVDPDSLFAEAGERLAAWPGGGRPRRWAPMTDIFHYQRPVSDEHWARRRPDRVPYGRIAVLKPEEIASYVYYHYQYQEERPGDGDKYGIIGLHENVLFFYSELPATLEAAPYEGKLKTKLRPDDWQAAMDPHFAKWPDAPAGEEIWRKLPLALEARSSQGRSA
ncbi:hypothetical protein J19TS2_40960 [Cohnella xylanilytica]|uniref:hypothetical protein n=1 Tax=Cohnella xylanilytica TaxID=557555 RepID=UPI001B293216|nr:hypothetical protein [Cohnella xylanilytica]GIO14541.1 hypothetical protein J19TS2_40960 [Cohnella xylanilytica]